MQLADLHCDLDPKLIDIIIERIDGLEYDAAVLTGDYHNKIAGDPDIFVGTNGTACAAH